MYRRTKTYWFGNLPGISKNSIINKALGKLLNKKKGLSLLWNNANVMEHSGKKCLNLRTSSKSSMVFKNLLWQVIAFTDTSRIASGEYHITATIPTAAIQYITCLLSVSFSWEILLRLLLHVLPMLNAGTSVHGCILYILCTWTWISQSTCPDTDGVKPL